MNLSCALNLFSGRNVENVCFCIDSYSQKIKTYDCEFFSLLERSLDLLKTHTHTHSPSSTIYIYVLSNNVSIWIKNGLEKRWKIKSKSNWLKSDIYLYFCFVHVGCWLLLLLLCVLFFFFFYRLVLMMMMMMMCFSSGRKCTWNNAMHINKTVPLKSSVITRNIENCRFHTVHTNYNLECVYWHIYSLCSADGFFFGFFLFNISFAHR